MRVKVSLYIAGKVHDEVVSAISYEEAKSYLKEIHKQFHPRG